MQGKRGFTSSVLRAIVTIDGERVSAASGDNRYPLAPGVRRIAVRERWLFDVGQAESNVEILSGQETRVFYTPPISSFRTGALGPTKRTRLPKVVLTVVLLVLFTFTAVAALGLVTGAIRIRLG